MNLSPWQRRIFDAAMQSHAQGRLGHALLLSGPPNLGKHQVAEAIAQRLLCKAPRSDGFACGACRSCQLFPAQQVGLSVTQAHPDLQRIGLEPNDKGDKLRTEISIDQVRRLGQWFSLTAQLGGPQVAVIEPADLMNASSGNALLKTLEEPAPNRFLLLVTSRPGRLPATIRSRCQRLEFRLPSPDEALQHLASQGLSGSEALAALSAARGNPGLAAVWLRDGAVQLRGEVIENLNAVGSGKTGPVEMAQRWLADENAELRLRFAAELALEAAASPFQRPLAGRSVLTAPANFSTISTWFDSINRTREQLRAPLRNDLVLAGLLREWRTMFETGR
ncbi:MAG: DNA polymerase III subunit delta' [Frankiaceae bacterium]|nr:DNA polymerase III subunit delta' [Arenimonas sp.]